MNYSNGWGWDNSTTWITTSSGTGSFYLPSSGYYLQPAPSLPSVADAPAELTDREWLDAQVAEVCELARAA